MSTLAGSRIFVAGHNGLVGRALIRRLQSAGCLEVITRSRDSLDLRDQSAVRRFFEEQRPAHVFLAAAKVGGILANSTAPADFIRDNLLIQCNVIEAAHQCGVNKLLFLGSSCIYPRHAVQPIREDSLLTGPLEPTNEAYAIAKIAGIKMCTAYRQQYGMSSITVMPTNLYGPHDNFDLATSHVLPALVRKFHEAKTAKRPSVEIWGTGEALREFLHVDDLADACVFLMERYDSGEPINVGSGKDITIRELAELIKSVVAFEGELSFDLSKPDGTPRKLLDCSKLHALDWSPRIDLREGIEHTYRWYLESQAPKAATL